MASSALQEPKDQSAELGSEMHGMRFKDLLRRLVYCSSGRLVWSRIPWPDTALNMAKDVNTNMIQLLIQSFQRLPYSETITSFHIVFKYERS